MLCHENIFIKANWENFFGNNSCVKNTFTFVRNNAPFKPLSMAK